MTFTRQKTASRTCRRTRCACSLVPALHHLTIRTINGTIRTADELRAEMTRLAASPDLTERTAKVLSVCETARYARHPVELHGAAARELADDMREIFLIK